MGGKPCKCMCDSVADTWGCVCNIVTDTANPSLHTKGARSIDSDTSFAALVHEHKESMQLQPRMPKHKHQHQHSEFGAERLYPETWH